jgi:hypothetical protein
VATARTAFEVAPQDRGSAAITPAGNLEFRRFAGIFVSSAMSRGRR